MIDDFYMPGCAWRIGKIENVNLPAPTLIYLPML